MKLTRRIRTLLYDDQSFTEFEIALLHTPSLQRLYELHQLGFADRIFIDASHSRLHHVIGVVHQAASIIAAVVSNLRTNGKEKLHFGTNSLVSVSKSKLAKQAEERVWAVRLMAFLHDLTHAPFGHTLEDEIQLVGQKHDEPSRQADAFYRLVVQLLVWIERNHQEEQWGSESGTRPTESEHHKLLEWYMDSPDINEPPATEEFVDYLASRWVELLSKDANPKVSLARLSSAELGVSLRHLDFAMRALLHLEIAHKELEKVNETHLPRADYAVLRLFDKIYDKMQKPLMDEERFEPHRDVYLLDIIGNTICADLLDYARRDSRNSGLKLDYDHERIVANMTVVSNKVVRGDIVTKDGLKPYPFNQWSLRTAVNIFSHKLRLDVPGELLNLLQVRFYVYERMLFHPTKCVAGAMLGAALQNIGWKTLPPHWRFVGDAVFLKEVRDSAKCLRDLLNELTNQSDIFGEEISKVLTSRLKQLPDNGASVAARHWIKERSTLTVDELKNVLQRYESFAPYRAAAAAMLDQLRKLEVEEKIPTTGPLPGASRIKFRSFLLKAAQVYDAHAEHILDAIFPTVKLLRAELQAGLRLLDRLLARRFHKVIFRLLPNAQAVNGNAQGLGTEEIAKTFLNPVIRKQVELEIADRANLPRGSVVIHCPPAKGPTKIANIMITDGKSDRQPTLRKITDLDPSYQNIFKDHQTTVTTQEEMYKSTWRLSASVAPPYDAFWPRINPVIGKVIHEVLSGGGVDEIRNDPHMIRELEGQVQTILDNKESVQSTLEKDHQSRNQAEGFVEKLREFLNATDASFKDKNDVEILDYLRQRLLSSSNEFTTEKIVEKMDNKEGKLVGIHVSPLDFKLFEETKSIWTNYRQVKDSLNGVVGTSLFGDNKEFNEVYRSIVALNSVQQTWLAKRLEDIRLPENVEHNRVVTSAEKNQVLISISDLVKQAENFQ